MLPDIGKLEEVFRTFLKVEAEVGADLNVEDERLQEFRIAIAEKLLAFLRARTHWGNNVLHLLAIFVKSHTRGRRRVLASLLAPRSIFGEEFSRSNSRVDDAMDKVGNNIYHRDW